MSFGRNARPGTAGTLTHRQDQPSARSDEITRLRAELEKAHVAIEDVEQRLAELVRKDVELRAELAEQIRLRAFAEQEVERLRLEISKPRETEDSLLRQELSVTLEELQVMLEELQAAHEALARADAAN